MNMYNQDGPATGVNLIKILHVQFTNVAIVLVESENNSYTGKLHV